jgi:hypothetical protein
VVRSGVGLAEDGLGIRCKASEHCLPLDSFEIDDSLHAGVTSYRCGKIESSNSDTVSWMGNAECDGRAQGCDGCGEPLSMKCACSQWLLRKKEPRSCYLDCKRVDRSRWR